MRTSAATIPEHPRKVLGRVGLHAEFHEVRDRSMQLCLGFAAGSGHYAAAESGVPASVGEHKDVPAENGELQE